MINEQAIRDQYPNASWFEDGFDISQVQRAKAAGPVNPVIQKKPWGLELWLVVTDRYAMKILYLNAGSRFSLQKHELKEESWLITKGEADVVLGENTLRAKAGDVLHVPTGVVHRITAVSDLEVCEVSTPELSDVVRLSDDFGRK